MPDRIKAAVLSRIILPEPNRTDRCVLYYHADDTISCGCDGLTIPTGGTVAFDTYFNGFFYPKYLRYTHVTSVSPRVSIEGKALVGVRVCTCEGERTLFEERVSGEVHLPAIDLTSLPAEGMLYLTVRAEDGLVRFLGGQWETELPSVNDVHVAAVMCTYRREDYVTRNLAQLRKKVWGDESCPIRETLDLFVVDNGRTLDLAQEPHVRLFPNRNCGGSGGFTRGLIEAHRRRDIYTHVLFMDDDISFETEALVKTVQLLRYAKPSGRPLCIAGQMLIEDRPTVQYEAGVTIRRGCAVSLNGGLDLSLREALLQNETEQDALYSGWYYCCMPLDVVDASGLPLPLFIEGDDAEYCLRTNARLLFMNGIGVWHKAFEEKYSVRMEYYVKRNELVLGALHDTGAGMWPDLWKLVRASGKSALLGDPRRIDFMLRGYRDFLRGPAFFLETDPEALNEALLVAMEKPAKNRLASLLTDPFRLLPVMGAFIRNYKKVRTQYIDRLGELTGMAFWERYLGI